MQTIYRKRQADKRIRMMTLYVIGSIHAAANLTRGAPNRGASGGAPGQVGQDDEKVVICFGRRLEDRVLPLSRVRFV
jgi:hypothetical protein